MCIDQADISKRSSQISLMRHIYSQAESVLAFLGETFDGCDVAKDVMKAASRDPSLHFKTDMEPHITLRGMG